MAQRGQAPRVQHPMTPTVTCRTQQKRGGSSLKRNFQDVATTSSAASAKARRSRLSRSGPLFSFDSGPVANLPKVYVSKASPKGLSTSWNSLAFANEAEPLFQNLRTVRSREFMTHSQENLAGGVDKFMAGANGSCSRESPRGKRIPSTVGGVHKWSSTLTKSKSLQQLPMSAVEDEAVFEQSDSDDGYMDSTMGDDEREDEQAGIESVMDELELLLLKSQRRLLKFFAGSDQSDSGRASLHSLPATTFSTMLLREISSLRKLLRHRQTLRPSRKMASLINQSSDDAEIKNIQAYHRRYLSNIDASVSDSAEDSGDPQEPGVNSETLEEKSLNDENGRSASPAFSLQTCSCGASRLPVLDENAIEKALDRCHQELFHNAPDLTSSSEFASMLTGDASPSGPIIGLWQQQAAEMLHLVNEHRRMALGAFSCSMDAFRVASEEHDEFVALREQQKEEHERHVEEVETGMSKQIANLLRVVEKQETQLVHQRFQMKKLTEQVNALREEGELRSEACSPLARSPPPTQDLSYDKRGPGNATSMPQLNRMPTSPNLRTTAVPRKQLRRTFTSTALSPTQTPRLSLSPDLQHQEIDSHDRLAQTPRWMVRAVSWLDLTERTGDSAVDE